MKWLLWCHVQKKHVLARYGLRELNILPLINRKKIHSLFYLEKNPLHVVLHWQAYQAYQIQNVQRHLTVSYLYLCLDTSVLCLTLRGFASYVYVWNKKQWQVINNSKKSDWVCGWFHLQPMLWQLLPIVLHGLRIFQRSAPFGFYNCFKKLGQS